MNITDKESIQALRDLVKRSDTVRMRPWFSRALLSPPLLDNVSLAQAWAQG